MPCPPRTFPLRRQLHTIPTDTQPHLTGHLPLPAPTFRGKPGMDARTNGLSPIFADKDTNMEQLAIGSLGELPKAAEAVITASGGRGVVAFFGAMGAGKTTLIREICTQLGVADNVTSPTFALVNHYRSGRGDNIFHFDFYRIEKLDEPTTWATTNISTAEHSAWSSGRKKSNRSCRPTHCVCTSKQPVPTAAR